MLRPIRIDMEIDLDTPPSAWRRRRWPLAVLVLVSLGAHWLALRVMPGLSLDFQTHRDRAPTVSLQLSLKRSPPTPADATRRTKDSAPSAPRQNRAPRAATPSPPRPKAVTTRKRKIQQQTGTRAVVRKRPVDPSAQTPPDPAPAAAHPPPARGADLYQRGLDTARTRERSARSTGRHPSFRRLPATIPPNEAIKLARDPGTDLSIEPMTNGSVHVKIVTFWGVQCFEVRPPEADRHIPDVVDELWGATWSPRSC